MRTGLAVIVVALVVGCFGQRSGGGGAGGSGGVPAEEEPAEEEMMTSSAAGEPLTGVCGLDEGSFPAECVACLEVACCTQLLLCEDNAECVALLTCVDGCEGDELCQSSCGASHPSGRIDYLEVASCALELCGESGC